MPGCLLGFFQIALRISYWGCITGGITERSFLSFLAG